MATTKRLPKALVCHPWMEMAGSELVAVWTLQALLGKYDVHLCTASGFDPDRWKKDAGTSFDRNDLSWIEAPRLPGAKNAAALPHLHRARFECFCRKIAGEFDVVISAYNPIAFGRPGLQIIGDHRWRDLAFGGKDNCAGGAASPGLKKRLRGVYQAAVDKFYYNPVENDFGPDDWFLSNSHWTQARFRQWVPQAHHDILYPPVPVPAGEPLPHKSPTAPYRFITLGRIASEKRLENAIRIVEKIRSSGHDAELSIVGKLGDDAYANFIRSEAADRPWVKLTGPVYGEAKNELLRKSAFGLQACPDEPFGIAAAELAHAGCLTWVAAGSGTTEIIPDRAFHFTNCEDAAQKITAALRLPAETLNGWRTTNRAYIREHFLPDVYIKNFHEALTSFLAHQKAPSATRAAA